MASNAHRVLLGFSGGIDSCAALTLLRQSGYDVVALTLDTSSDEKALAQAQLQAERLEAELVVADVKADFSKYVIGYFVQSYLRGETPAPCTVCNPAIKWQTLYRYALQSGCEHIATGHYFRITKIDDKYFVTRAKDRTKDQSYYLWDLPQHILSMALTPMGEVIKRDIEEYGKRPESMGVCFLRGRPYAELIGEGRILTGGNIVDKQGNILAHHNSVAHYTIGQRRGIGVDGVVVAIDGETNSVTVGSDDDLYCSTIELRDVNVVDEKMLSADDISVMVRGLGRNPTGFCAVRRHKDNLLLELQNPAWAIAKGQPVVLYRGDIVIGGGWVK